MGQPGRPPGTRTPEEKRWVGVHIKMPPELRDRLRAAVDPNERSAFIRDALDRALKRLERGAE